MSGEIVDQTKLLSVLVLVVVFIEPGLELDVLKELFLGSRRLSGSRPRDGGDDALGQGGLEQTDAAGRNLFFFYLGCLELVGENEQV